MFTPDLRQQLEAMANRGLVTARYLYSLWPPDIFGKSDAFLAHQETNTFVYKAGGYRFTDFLRIGLPMNILALLVSVYLIPLFWPLVPQG